VREERLGGLTVRLTGGSDGDAGGGGPLVVLCHGYGAPGSDLVPLGDWLGQSAPARFAFPEAPLSLGLGFFGDSRAWWEIDIARLERAIMSGEHRDLSRDVPAGLAAARARLVGALDALPGVLDAPPAPLVIGGFSQGAMLTCDVALRDERPLGGLVLLSGTLLAEEQWLSLMAARAGLRVFQSHGRQDPLLPFSVACRLRDALLEAGLDVTFVEHGGGHEIPENVLEGLAEFLASLP